MSPAALNYAGQPAQAGAEPRKLHVIQGEFAVCDEPETMMTTILGSCVAACMRDPVSGIGGMNHFLLPGDDGSSGLRYGVQSMELLVNALLRRGARRDRLEVKLFGGARLVRGLTDVGSQNAAFAQQFLKDEGLTFAGGSLGGDRARRIQYWPVGGRARQTLLAPHESDVFAVEKRPALAPRQDDDGGLELF